MAAVSAPRPLPTSDPADLAAAVRRRRRASTLDRMNEDELRQEVRKLDGAPLARGGRLRLSWDRVKRTLAILRRPPPAPHPCDRCHRRQVPICTNCRRPCGAMSEGLIWLYSTCHPNSPAACPSCWTGRTVGGRCGR